MDGFATTALIRQGEGTQRRVPIIALTAHEAKSCREPCLRAGMNDILSKPYSLQECAELLLRWVEPTRVPPVDKSPSFPQASSHDNVLSLIDAKAVADLRQLRGAGRVDLYTELVGLFQTASRDAAVQLQTALQQRNLPAAGAVCHKFAASAANVGALVFARELRRLETTCAQGDHASARHKCDTLVAALPALIDELLRNQLRESA